MSGRVFRGLGSNMLEVVDAGDQPLPNLRFAEGVGRHLAAAGVRLVDNRFHLLRRQRVRR